MQEKEYTLLNFGMNKDLSISKVGKSNATDNHNIRLNVDFNGTLLSITNERGTRKILDPLDPVVAYQPVEGKVLGWNSLGNIIIVFTTTGGESNPDKIYVIEDNEIAINLRLLYSGNLGFDERTTIDSVVYKETEEIQKIYWVDGVNVLRFLNFMTTNYARQGSGVDTQFDSTKGFTGIPEATITKDNTGNTRPNGTIQYFLDFYDKDGAGSCIAWASDLVYLSPIGRGGTADGVNNNRISITFTAGTLNRGYSRFRVFSIVRTSLNGEIVAYKIADADVSSSAITIVDDYSNDELVDWKSILYLGSAYVKPDTIAFKDKTLFIGNLTTENGLDDEIQTDINTDRPTITFVKDKRFPIVENTGEYPYENQLRYTSSEITTFKYGELYRFALVFGFANGRETKAFWIADVVNNINNGFPSIDTTNNEIVCVRAVCTMNAALCSALVSRGIVSAKLCVAEATYADRSIKAQGILNPTVFNVLERYNNGVFAMPSWIARPVNGNITYSHFHSLKKSEEYFGGEVECNYWEGIDELPPYEPPHASPAPENIHTVSGSTDITAGYNYLLPLLSISYKSGFLNISAEGYVTFHMFQVELTAETITPEIQTAVFNFQPDSNFPEGWTRQRTDKGADTLVKTYDGFRVWYFESDLFSSKVGLFENKYDAIKGALGELRSYVARLTSYGFASAIIPPPERTGLFNGFGEFDWWKRAVAKDAETTQDVFVTLSGQTVGVWSETLLGAVEESSAQYKNTWKWTATQQSADEYSAASNLPSGGTSSIVKPNKIVGKTYSDIQNAPSYSAAAEYERSLMYVDENILTFESPEITHNALQFDDADYKLRIVGVVDLTSVISDYTVDATQSHYSSNGLSRCSFSGKLTSGAKASGIIAWPLWKESELSKTVGTSSHESILTPDDYEYSSSLAVYWMYLWGRTGKIDGYYISKEVATATSTDGMVTAEVSDENSDYSKLHKKVFANLHFGYSSTYVSAASSRYELTIDSLRIFNSDESKYTGIKVGELTRNYDGVIDMVLVPPIETKYPILYSNSECTNTTSAPLNRSIKLWSNDPVRISYASSPHAVVTLDCNESTHTVLPVLRWNQTTSLYEPEEELENESVFWDTLDNTTSLTNHVYSTTRGNTVFSLAERTTPYLFIAELYIPYGETGGPADTRYGGTSDWAKENCRYIPAGNTVRIVSGTPATIYGNRGDTYFQRWDNLRTKPYSEDSVNNVIDIVSAMLETHINLDGRTDYSRATKQIASIDISKFGQINPVYSQADNARVYRASESPDTNGVYSTALTWTLEKQDEADIDEWAHITLANSLKLNGSHGSLNAIRNYGDRLYTFQDRAISEIMFNTRVQIPVSDGVPIEISNSAKVDGFRELDTKYGTKSRNLIVAGKKALYFIDTINRSFCTLNGQGVQDMTDALGFRSWFRREDRGFLRLYYDSFVSDVYFQESPSSGLLAYNEDIGAFTSFYNYDGTSLMVNTELSFISANRLSNSENTSFWKHNAGYYGHLYGVYYPSSVEYRVAPDPQTDKIWTNIDYRADFFADTLLGDGSENTEFIIDESQMGYLPNETFDSISVRNQYQNADWYAGATTIIPPKKRFRIWRYVIPRDGISPVNGTQYYSNRIRNPWISVVFSKNSSASLKTTLMQLHDIKIKYFE